MEVQLTKGQVALIDEADYKCINLFSWCATQSNGSFYAIAHHRGYGKMILMHRLIMGAKDGELVDHKNHNGLDNRRSNLRICNTSLNFRNKIQSPHSSKYKGVWWDSAREKWQVSICLGGKPKKRVYLGRYNSEDEAGIAYNIAAKEHFGEFALLNIVGGA